MKTIINYIIACILFLSVSGCEKEPQLSEHIAEGYYRVNTNFVYPDEAYKKYTIIMNGDTIKAGLEGYIDRTNPSAKIEVFENGKLTAEYSATATVSEDNQSFRFIKVGNKPVEMYREENYVTFTPVVLFSGNQDDYQLYFGDVTLMNNKVNYLPKSNTTGKFEINRKDETAAIFERDIVISSGSKLPIMQLSDTDFLVVPEDNEPAPQTKQNTKVRFFYTQDAFPQAKSLKLVIYYSNFKFSDFYEAHTVMLKPGELSEYVLIDHFHFNQKYVNGVYDLIDPETNVKIVDNIRHTKTYLAFGQNNSTIDGGYMFETIRFTDNTHLGGDNVRSPGIPVMRKVW